MFWHQWAKHLEYAAVAKGLRKGLAAGLVGTLGELQDNRRPALPNREPLCIGPYILHSIRVRLGNSNGTPDTSDCLSALGSPGDGTRSSPISPECLVLDSGNGPLLLPAPGTSGIRFRLQESAYDEFPVGSLKS